MKPFPSSRVLSELKKALEIVEHAETIDDARRQLRRVIASLERQPNEEAVGEIRVRGRSFFDRLVERMLEQVKRGESREALIDETLCAVADDAAACAGLCYLVLESFIGPDDVIDEVRITASFAVHRGRLANFKNSGLTRLPKSPLIRGVLIQREVHDFLYTEAIRGYSYFGEFDQLGGAKAWLCALPLPAADANQPERMLAVLYPLVGPADSPALPRGANMEWRTLTFLRPAYEMLNHQLSSTTDWVVRQRREILAELAPGLVNHEINQQLKSLDESTKLMNWAIHQVERHIPGTERAFDALVDGFVNVFKAIERLRAISDAFNNLERRSTTVPVSLIDLFAEIQTLMHYRLARLGGKLTIEGDIRTEIVTNVALIEHVFINIFTNALEAIEEHTESQRKRLIENENGPLAKGEGDKENGLSDGKVAKSPTPELRAICRFEGDRVELDLVNNGPPITDSRPERIFEKGVTTKKRGVGHGLGLFLCRMIMNHLGGSISLIDHGQLESGSNVGFRLVMPQVRKGVDELSALAPSSGDGRYPSGEIN